MVNYAPLQEDVRGVKLRLHTFLTSAPDGSEWSTSHRGRLLSWAPEPVWKLRRISTQISKCSSLQLEYCVHWATRDIETKNSPKNHVPQAMKPDPILEAHPASREIGRTIWRSKHFKCKQLRYTIHSSIAGTVKVVKVSDLDTSYTKQEHFLSVFITSEPKILVIFSH